MLSLIAGSSLAYSPDDVANGIPQFLWDMSPPSIFCLNSFFEGFETALGLTRGWTSELLNDLGLTFIETSNASRIDVLTYREYIEDMYEAMDQLPERHQYDPDGPFLSIWNLMQTEWLLKTIVRELPKHSNAIVSTLLENFGLVYNNASLTYNFQTLLSGLNAKIMDETTDESCDLYNSALSLDEDKFVAFWSSALVAQLLNNLISGMELTLNHLKIYASLANAGTSVCNAVDTSFVRDTTNSDKWVCVVLSLTGWLAGCGEQKPQCDMHRKGQIPVPRSICTKGGPTVDPLDGQSIVDLNMTHELPEDFTMPINTNDGRVSYWLWRATQYLAGWSSKAFLCNWSEERPTDLVPGWETIKEWRSHQPAADLQTATNHSSIPFLFISKKRDSGCDYLITVRGTVNSYEWFQDYTASHANIPGYDSEFHRGSFASVNVMLPVIENTLERMQELHCTDKMRVIVTGHSLGGATAQLITLILAARYGTEKMQFELVTFGAVNSLSPHAVYDLMDVANITTWIAELDGVPALPCSTSIFGSPRCPAVETYGNWGSGRDVYQAHPNRVVIPLSAFEGREPKAMTADVWADLKFDLVRMELEEADFEIAGPLQLTAWHVCAYSCFLSRNFCVEDEASAWQCDPHICPII